MQRLGFILAPGFQVTSLSALTAFELANADAASPRYDIHLLSEHGGAVRSSLGMCLETEAFDRRRFDTLLINGGLTPLPLSPGLLAFLRRASKQTRRLASVCTGAFALAEAGLLDGRRVTTHWIHARELQRRYPRVTVDDDRIFIVDGQIWSSAGMTAGVDLALGMVENDLGAEVARDIARKMVVYHRRAGGQSQYSTLLELDAKSDRVQRALTHARGNLKTALSVEQLADAAHLSPRQFSRLFVAETGQSPAKAVEKLRVEAARLMMEQGHHPIETVARETGFGDRERMRRAFLRAFGQPPQAMRRHVAATEPRAA